MHASSVDLAQLRRENRRLREDAADSDPDERIRRCTARAGQCRMPGGQQSGSGQPGTGRS
jgi:hypothetical protein